MVKWSFKILIMTSAIFSNKEMYTMSHTLMGREYEFKRLPDVEQLKLKQNNMHLMSGIHFTESNGFPILEAFSNSMDYDFYPYCDYRKLEGKGQGIHFFIDDYKFSVACDAKLEQTTSKLMKFDVVFCPDYSLYVDTSEHINKHNIYLSRFAGAYWQKCGLQVIPTASWSNADSFEYCFEGFPCNSVIGISGVGVKWSRPSYRLWQYGVRALEETLTPSLIVVYGDSLEVPGLQTPMFFIKDQITKNFRYAANR